MSNRLSFFRLYFVLVCVGGLLSVPAFGLSQGSDADHNCRINVSGGAECWGNNSQGQLGDGSNIDRSLPFPVVGLSSGVAAIAAAGNHTCALTTTGAVLCWGRNNFGQLGDGSTSSSLVPVAVLGLSNGVTSISTGSSHSCAVTGAASVVCWGLNGSGQLGDGTTTSSSVLVTATGLAGNGFRVTSGERHSCAVTTGGAALCWGYNLFGQLGDGTKVDTVVPNSVSGLASGVVEITAGQFHTCARTNTGAAFCWGLNTTGQVGHGMVANTVLVPTGVSGLASGTIAISAGARHSCALTTAGAALCWGSNVLGQLGDTTTVDRNTPATVQGLTSGGTAINAGFRHSCFETNSAQILCWGNNSFGQLGHGSLLISNSPVPVMGLSSGAVAISAGFRHMCAVTSAGGVVCSGRNTYGQLGDGTTTDQGAPTAVSGLANGVVSVEAGNNHSCALTNTGGVQCWGANFNSQLGDGTANFNSTVPVQVSGLTLGVSALSTSLDHTCALNLVGGVVCWGRNSFGQLGDGTTVDRNVPVSVAGLASGVIAIGTGETHSCAITNGGAALCWGGNFSGQLGTGNFLDSSVPVAVSGLVSGGVAIDGGGEHSCALTSTGAALCWGGNFDGQIGDGTTAFSNVPVAVSGLASDTDRISTGGNHTCAITSTGEALCWGSNIFSQLGDGTTMNSLVPVGVSGLATGALAISAGARHSCALSDSGAGLCWGSNELGELGFGTVVFSTVPIPVPEADVVIGLLAGAALLGLLARRRRRRAFAE